MQEDEHRLNELATVSSNMFLYITKQNAAFFMSGSLKGLEDTALGEEERGKIKGKLVMYKSCCR